MQVSLLGNQIESWSNDCLIKLGGAQYASCEVAPVYAQNYFNSTVYFNEAYTTAFAADYAGYSSSGYIYNASVCVTTVDTNYFCTV
jgi:hypothetical protein